MVLILALRQLFYHAKQLQMYEIRLVVMEYTYMWGAFQQKILKSKLEIFKLEANFWWGNR